MKMSVPSLNKLGKQSGKQIRLSVVPSLCSTRLGTLDAIRMPKVAARPLRHASCCFPHASPVSETRPGKQKTALKDRSKQLLFLSEIWSGRRDSNPRPQPWQGCVGALSTIKAWRCPPSYPAPLPPAQARYRGRPLPRSPCISPSALSRSRSGKSRSVANPNASKNFLVVT